VAQSVLGMNLRTIYQGILPFLMIYLLALGVVTYVPDIALSSMRFFY